MNMTLKEQKEHFIKFYGGRLPVHDYDYFKQRFNEIIDLAVKESRKKRFNTVDNLIGI